MSECRIAPPASTLRPLSTPSGGGVQAYMARDVDGGAIAAYEEIAVVEQVAPRLVLVTRLYEQSQPEESPQ